jgi:hypothetical protein
MENMYAREENNPSQPRYSLTRIRVGYSLASLPPAGEPSS